MKKLIFALAVGLAIALVILRQTSEQKEQQSFGSSQVTTPASPNEGTLELELQPISIEQNSLNSGSSNLISTDAPVSDSSEKLSFRNQTSIFSSHPPIDEESVEEVLNDQNLVIVEHWLDKNNNQVKINYTYDSNRNLIKLEEFYDGEHFDSQTFTP